jgi:hypothetical protein
MSEVHPSTAPPAPGVPVIPPPPPRDGRRRKAGSDPRALVAVAALVVGAGLGIGAYHYVPGVDALFDYWLLLALG